MHRQKLAIYENMEMTQDNHR